MLSSLNAAISTNERHWIITGHLLLSSVIIKSSNWKRPKHQVLTENLYNYARENLALVNIYIKQPVVTKILRDQRIPVIWFVANCGGILGLCMGFSIVTVFEVLHCLTNVTFSSLANWYRNVRINFWNINIFTLQKIQNYKRVRRYWSIHCID